MITRRIESLDEVKKLLDAGFILHTTQATSIRVDAVGIPFWLSGANAGTKVSLMGLFVEIWHVIEPDPEPAIPEPPDGVENAVVCPVTWNKDSCGFTYTRFNGAWSPLHQAMSQGATHFGFEHGGIVYWRTTHHVWRWLKGVNRFLVEPAEGATQVRVKWVCLSVPKDTE